MSHRDLIQRKLRESFFFIILMGDIFFGFCVMDPPGRDTWIMIIYLIFKASSLYPANI